MGYDLKNWEFKFTVHGQEVCVYCYETDEIDEANDNIDIFIDYQNETFAGNLMTPSWVANYLATESNSDVFWYCDHGLILPDLSRKKIIEAISRLIEDGIEIGLDYLREIFVLSEPI